LVVATVLAMVKVEYRLLTVVLFCFVFSCRLLTHGRHWWTASKTVV